MNKALQEHPVVPVQTERLENADLQERVELQDVLDLLDPLDPPDPEERTEGTDPQELQVQIYSCFRINHIDCVNLFTQAE